jgi:hypothetical protein
MSRKTISSRQFGVCTDNSGYAASLEVGKLYAVVPDPAAAKHGYVRVVDESGEDYGYSAERFLLDVPPALVSALSARGREHVRRTNRALQPMVRSRRRQSA